MNDSMTIFETMRLLHNYEIKCNEEDVRQWITEGKILATANGEDYDIKEPNVLDFLVDLRNEGTAYEKGIDDKTKIERLEREIMDLNEKVNKLINEKIALEMRLGISPFD